MSALLRASLDRADNEMHNRGQSAVTFLDQMVRWRVPFSTRLYEVQLTKPTFQARPRHIARVCSCMARALTFDTRSCEYSTLRIPTSLRHALWFSPRAWKRPCRIFSLFTHVSINDWRTLPFAHEILLTNLRLTDDHIDFATYQNFKNYRYMIFMVEYSSHAIEYRKIPAGRPHRVSRTTELPLLSNRVARPFGNWR